jgi:hypothetical protein
LRPHADPMKKADNGVRQICRGSNENLLIWHFSNAPESIIKLPEVERTTPSGRQGKARCRAVA